MNEQPTWVPVTVNSRLFLYIYSLSGEDDTNFLYGIGKKILKLHQLDCEELANFGESDEFQITNTFVTTA